ncbi:MAG: alpha-L-fucosidase, partial [Opitutaceae bacterium]|nr:alpha-L-fucosidase [Opitutaceae bacterium]
MKNIRTAALLAAFLAISPPLFPADAAPKPLFAADLSNAEFSPGSWAWENGVLAGKGLGNIWTRETYGDFDLSLEFRCSEKTDAGVFLRCSDINDPAHSTFEVQIAGGSRNASRATGAIYGCLAPSRQIKTEPGKWYQYIIQARGRRITVRFDGGQIIDMDLAKWKTFRKNPDGSGNMLSKAGKDMATKGRLGLQSHAGKVEFRNISVSALASAPVAAEPDGDSVPSWARETGKQKEERMAWWTHDRFGMFIHWGAYALAARHEQVKGKEKISDADYQKYFDYFNPDLYNPKEWAARAKAAGMKYVVITTKHHEGFCLWDTKHTDFKVTNTPYGKDLIRPFVDAFRAEGIRIGFYYSMIDWHHPDFTFDRVHPNGPKDPAERKAANEKRDMGKYRQYMKNQVTELL